MRTCRTLGASALLVSLLAVTAGSNAGADATANLACATQVVATWTLPQIANETIVVPVNATSIGSMGPAARAGYGGLLLFGTTAPPTLTAILATLQRERPGHFTMMVMTDEEGGGVMRLTNLVSPVPWAQIMGRDATVARIGSIARRVGTQLARAGVNTDLAPVLDVDGRAAYPGSANPDGFRSFSGVPAVAAADGTAFMEGLMRANVTSVVKHFPGLGYSTRNTDYGPAATLPWSTLQSTGLVPFRQAIDHGATAVMLSNARVPGLSSLPSSISPDVIKVLRQTLGFRGLIVTDSLSAGAISALHLAEPAAAVRALAAGADLILFGSPSSPSSSLARAGQISSAIVAAVNGGTLAQSTLVDAAAQVLAARNTVPCPTPAG
jgi:beta-N-acetylhexosaminidase